MRSFCCFLLLLSLAGCAEINKNPVDNLIDSKSPDEVFTIFGKPMLVGCQDNTDITGKCLSELTDAVAAARSGGYNEINVAHFTPGVLARFTTALKSSPEAKSLRLSRDLNKSKYDF